MNQHQLLHILISNYFPLMIPCYDLSIASEEGAEQEELTTSCITLVYFESNFGIVSGIIVLQA